MPISRPFAALVFDLDGTVLATHDLIAATINRVLVQRGFPVAEVAAVGAMSGLPLETIFETVLPPAAVEQALGCIADYRALFDRDVIPAVLPIEGAPEALRAIAATKRWPLAIATGRLGTTARQMLGHTGLLHFFTAVVGIDVVPRPKPYPDVLFRALDDLGGLPATDVLMIGDTAADVAVARSAGAPVCAVTWGAQEREPLLRSSPDWCVDTWDELLDLLGVTLPAGAAGTPAAPDRDPAD
ncbi:MAG: HAD-IA family hydrolase [Chloroflexi bacterium]|nr:HAD-IA family hydrolase [Chloroflexota bacterium]